MIVETVDYDAQYSLTSEQLGPEEVLLFEEATASNRILGPDLIEDLPANVREAIVAYFAS